MNTLLSFQSVSVNYGGIQALRNVSFSVEEGKILTLIGCNGAGKTTCLRAISGMVPLKAGSIQFAGDALSPQNAKRPHLVAHKKIAHVPEGRGIFPELSVEENLSLGAWLESDQNRFEANREKAFTLFPRLKERRNQAGGTLSGGEQQMLAIGRALMANPRLLLLDEPSLGLAPQIIQTIFAIVQEINRSGTTVLLVEQNAHLALKIAHQGVVLDSGELLLVDEAANLLNNAKVREAYLGVT